MFKQLYKRTPTSAYEKWRKIFREKSEEARIYLQNNQLKKAVDNYEYCIKSYELNKGKVDKRYGIMAYFRLASAYAKDKQTAHKVDEICRKLSSILGNQKTIEGYMLLAGIYGIIGDNLKTSFYCKKALTLNRSIVKELRKTKDYAKIIACNKKALELNPPDIPGHFDSDLVKKLQQLIRSETKVLSAVFTLKTSIEKIMEENFSMKQEQLLPLKNIFIGLETLLITTENLELIENLCFLATCVNKNIANSMIKTTLRVLNYEKKKLLKQNNDGYLLNMGRKLNKLRIKTKNKKSHRVLTTKLEEISRKRKVLKTEKTNPKIVKIKGLLHTINRISTCINTTNIGTTNALQIMSIIKDNNGIMLSILLNNKDLSDLEKVFLTQRLNFIAAGDSWQELLKILKENTKKFEEATKTTALHPQAKKLMIKARELSALLLFLRNNLNRINKTTSSV